MAASYEYYTVPFCLFTEDGKRGAEVRLRSTGEVYFVEREWVEGTTYKNKEPFEEIGPYETLEAAERAAVNRPWFLGQNDSS